MNKQDWPSLYEIHLGIQLGAQWESWFEGLELITSDNETVIRGFVLDESALYGILGKVRDLRLPLISVRRLEADA